MGQTNVNLVAMSVGLCLLGLLLTEYCMTDSMSYWTIRRKINRTVEQQLNAIHVREQHLTTVHTDPTVPFSDNGYVSNATVNYCYSDSDLYAATNEFCFDAGRHHADSPVAILDRPFNSDNALHTTTDMSFEPDISTVTLQDADLSNDYNPLSDESDETDDDKPDIGEQLCEWALMYSVQQNALSALLKILQSDHQTLPRDAQTLLGIPTNLVYQKRANGLYYHFGVEESIKCLLRSVRVDCIPEELSVQFNVDGLPLFKSSPGQFWPILGRIDNVQVINQPFVVGLFYGESKPMPCEEFLTEFLDEMANLHRVGISYENVLYKIKISAFVCDAPARAFLKNVRLHNGYYSCERCVQMGEWLHNKVVFLETDAPKRTNADFQRAVDPSDRRAHRLGPCSLSTLSVDLVSDFPLDYMHLCCLGIMRRILHFLTKPFTGTGIVLRRLNFATIQAISTHLISMRHFIPSEFSRKPRALIHLDRWKATEFRFFMLYAGPVVMQNKVDRAVYDNFMLFSVAMCILLSPNFCNLYVDYAEKLLKSFVEHFSQVYGKENVVYNVHSVIHLPDDARRYGFLDRVSAFPFENYLGQLKKLVRKPELPLQQAVRKLIVMRDFADGKQRVVANGSIFHVKRLHYNGPVPQDLFGASQYKEATTETLYISIKEGDNCFEIHDNGHHAVVCIVNIVEKDNLLYLVYRRYRDAPQPMLYMYPCDSRNFDIRVVLSELSPVVETCSLASVTQKIVLLPHQSPDYYVAFPMLHT